MPIFYIYRDPLPVIGAPNKNLDPILSNFSLQPLELHHRLFYKNTNKIDKDLTKQDWIEMHSTSNVNCPASDEVRFIGHQQQGRRP